MRTVVNTILNSLIKEFIKLIANYSKGYKKLINSSLSSKQMLLRGKNDEKQ